MFAHPCGGTDCRAHAQFPAFAAKPLVFPPSSSEVAVKFFGLLYLSVHNLPQLCMHIVIFSPYSFPVFCFWWERFVQLQTLHHCSKRSQLQACLKTRPDQVRKLTDSQTDAQQWGTIQTRINLWAYKQHAGEVGRVMPRGERKKRQGRSG